MIVYVIEDDGAVRAALSVFLEEEGYAAVCFANAHDFLADANPGPHDLILLDLGLPDLSGADLSDLLRRRGIEAKVIAISGLKAGAFESAVRRVAPVAAFRKPLNLEALLAGISAIASPKARAV